MDDGRLRTPTKLMFIIYSSTFLNKILYLLQNYYPIILYGLGVTFLLSIVGTIGGFILSLPLTQARLLKIDKKRDSKPIKTLKKSVVLIGNSFVTLMRGTPMIVQAMIIFYGVASLNIFPWWSPLPAGLIIVTINTTAYISESLRGGISSVGVGQMEAGRSLGLNRRQTMRKIIWPQAIKNSLPNIGNEFVVNLKDTSVLSVIAVVDLFYALRQAAGKTLAYVEAFSIAAVIYLIITIGSNYFIKYLEKRVGQVGRIS